MKTTILCFVTAAMCVGGCAVDTETHAHWVPFSPGGPVHHDIPQSVARVLEALAVLPLSNVQLVEADRQAVLDYIEEIVQGGTFRRILHPLGSDTPRHETAPPTTLRLVDTTYLAALCIISREAGLRFGITSDGTLVLIDADDSLSSTVVYYVLLKHQRANVAQYEVLFPRKVARGA